MGRDVILMHGQLTGASDTTEAVKSGMVDQPEILIVHEKQTLALPSIGVYNQNAMNRRRHICSVVFVLFVSMLTNTFGWAFNGEVFAHELDHEHHVLSLDPTAHLEAHQRAVSNDDGHLDAATHLCLHAAGQYQPFFFTSPPLVPASIGMEALTRFVSFTVPESIPDSPLHPPKNSFAS